MEQTKITANDIEGAAIEMYESRMESIRKQFDGVKEKELRNVPYADKIVQILEQPFPEVEDDQAWTSLISTFELACGTSHADHIEHCLSIGKECLLVAEYLIENRHRADYQKFEWLENTLKKGMADCPERTVLRGMLAQAHCR